ncbi:MAG: hypothetical protein EPN97_09780 [Alphaproteobacteria bacterium]|nr:MAG: hypothetical protein EPN97_09780 [Alphaproteobacteria bacterium]
MSEPDKVPQQPDEIHFQICQRAAETLGRLVDGNGLKADQVRLSRHETLVHQVPGYIHVELKPDISKKQYKGNVPRGKVLGGADGVHMEAAGLVRDFVKDINVITQVVQEIKKDEGKGFGMENFTVPLPATAKEFSVVEKCLKCNGNQFYQCVRCHSQGHVPCQGCNAQGYAPCPQCHGSGQYQQPGGGQGPCNRCNAQGRIQCLQCNGQRNMKCGACNGQGRIDCTECDRSGFWTNVYQLAFHADGEFVIDRQQVPPDVLAVIDTLGVRNLATKGLAQIFRTGVESKEKFITIPYLAFLPIAQAEFTIEGKPYPAMIAGLPGRIMSIQPVLDTAIKPGINALYKLSKGPMAAQALVDQACRFRLIRQVLTGLSKQSKNQVYKALTAEYPVGLSDKYAKATIRYANDAVLAIGRGPRLKGLLAGTAGAALLAAIYFMGPVRPQLLQSMIQSGHKNHMFLPDLAVWGLGYLAALYAIKFLAAGGLKKFLPDDVQSEAKGLPSAGEHGLYAIGATLAVWAAMAFAAPVKPEWILSLLSMSR